MSSQGAPLGREAAPNTDAIGNNICFSVPKGAGTPNHEEICPEPCLRILLTCLRKGKFLYLLQRLLVSEAVSQLFSEENSLLVPVGCHHTIVERCEVEEPEKAQGSFDTLLLLEPLSMMLRGIMFTSRASLSR